MSNQPTSAAKPYILAQNLGADQQLIVFAGIMRLRTEMSRALTAMHAYYFPPAHEVAASAQRLDAAQHARWPAITESSSLGGDPSGFVWLLVDRAELSANTGDIARLLQVRTGTALLDLHIKDLLNPQHPSHFDYASSYDMVIFRRLRWLAHDADVDAPEHSVNGTQVAAMLRPEQLDTLPLGFVVLPGMLLTVHESVEALGDSFVRRFTADMRQLPPSPADLMLRIINTLVDNYLDLRRALTQDLNYWQTQLLAPGKAFSNWQKLLATRNQLRDLEDICEGQHDAMQEWLDNLLDMPQALQAEAKVSHDLLVARTRDIIEHIGRVRQHINRLEQSIETAVQIHFSAQAHRTNAIMRVLTTITAIFLPLNLVTGFFGMNFDFLPLIHNKQGIWWAVGLMLLVALVLALVFWRKRYLTRTDV